MILKPLFCVSFLLVCVTAQCPELCKCYKFFDQIRTMDCRNASLFEVPRGHFEEVSWIDLGYNNITKLKNDTFMENKSIFINRFTKLQILYLYNIGLQTIEANAFRGLRELERLKLSDNNITTLPPNMFDDNVKLQDLELDLNINLILPENGFRLPDLGVLLIDYCGLKHIPRLFFKKMFSLYYVNLRGNKLTQVFDPQIILSLPYLRRLDLSYNQFISLPVGLNQTLAKKVEINFEGNFLACDCELESSSSLNEEKKLYDSLVCGNPTRSTLKEFIQYNCTNKTQMKTTLIPTSVASTLAVTGYTPITIDSREKEQNQSIPSQNQDPTDSTDRNHSEVHMNALTDVNFWWVGLSLLMVGVIIIAIMVALIKKHKRVRHYFTSHGFSTLTCEDEEQNL